MEGEDGLVGNICLGGCKEKDFAIKFVWMVIMSNAGYLNLR